LHKAIIYANWDWEETVRDALYQSGFGSFDEQETALQTQRQQQWGLH